MYHKAFPRCTVSGPVDPVPFDHLLSGAVPRKCHTCQYLFEGECARALEQVQDYLSLDYGPCPVEGATDPVLIDATPNQSTVKVPAKCAHCANLKLDSIRGFVCNVDAQIWGALPRSLDWGAWTPAFPNLRLASGRMVSDEILRAVGVRNEVEAVKAFRDAHPDATLREARDAYAELLARYP